MTPIARPREDAAAERLYAEYSERLLTFCLRQLGSYAEAEDAVQITFLCALRALRRGVVLESESAWLYAIARNVCRWQRRTASRRPAAGAIDVEVLAAAAENEDAELLSDLRAALGTLPERQRRALLLREWQGLSASEIADRLGLSPPATHALLTRARRSLALALTAPRRAATGLATLAYELRGWIKAALGGASAKVAATAVAVAGVAAGGVAVESGIGSWSSPRIPAEVSRPAPHVPGVARGRVVSRPAAGSTTAGRPAAGRARSTRGTAAISRPSASSGEQTSWGRPRPAPSAGPAPGRSAPDEPTTPAQDPLAGAALDPPELPTVDLPPVDLPPLDFPSADLPPVDVPPLEPPTDLLPPVDLPLADPPPADLAPVDPPPLVP